MDMALPLFVSPSSFVAMVQLWLLHLNSSSRQTIRRCRKREAVDQKAYQENGQGSERA
jgi:hypothetical protein